MHPESDNDISLSQSVPILFSYPAIKYSSRDRDWLRFCPATDMKTIFILEDETGIRDALQLLLSFEDYDVRSFSTIAAFNNRDHSVVPDVFILDVMMPDGMGTDVCNELKNAPETAGIPVIIISAHAKAENVTQSCKADAFIAKPFDIDDVLVKIENLINSDTTAAEK